MKKGLVSKKRGKQFSELGLWTKPLVRISTGKAIQRTGPGHVNRRTLKTEKLRSSPPSRKSQKGLPCRPQAGCSVACGTGGNFWFIAQPVAHLILLEGKEVGPQRFRGFFCEPWQAQRSEVNFPYPPGTNDPNSAERGILARTAS